MEAKTIILTKVSDEKLGVKEGYDTIKRRVNAIGDFFEVTDPKGKITLSKDLLGTFYPASREKAEEKKPVKEAKKLTKTGEEAKV